MDGFQWCRSANGYVWRQHDNRRVLEHDYVEVRPEAVRNGRFRVEIPRGGETPWGPLRYEWTVYRPADVLPPLFRSFAGLVDDQDEVCAERVLAFARQHGHLTLHSGVSGILRPDDRITLGRVAPLVAETAQLAASSWDRRWRELCGVSDRADQYRPVLDADNQSVGFGETFEVWARNARVMKKLLELYDGLKRSPRPAADRQTLESFIGEELDGRVQFTIDWQGRRSDLRSTGHLDLRPRDLLGFIWLQFARQVAGAEEFRQCPQCGHYYSLLRRGLTANQRRDEPPERKPRTDEPPERKPRTDATYCSDGCRKAHHYKTKTKAKRRKAKREKSALSKGATSKQPSPKELRQ